MNRNPLDQLKAMRARRAADRAELQRNVTSYGVGDTQPIPRYPSQDDPGTTPTGPDSAPRRSRPLIVGLAAGAVAGGILAFTIPAIAGGLGGSPSADVSSSTSQPVRRGGGGDTPSPDPGSTDPGGLVGEAPSGAPTPGTETDGQLGQGPGAGVCPAPPAGGPGAAAPAPGRGGPPAPPKHGAPEPPSKGKQGDATPPAPPTPPTAAPRSAK